MRPPSSFFYSRNTPLQPPTSNYISSWLMAMNRDINKMDTTIDVDIYSSCLANYSHKKEVTIRLIYCSTAFQLFFKTNYRSTSRYNQNWTLIRTPNHKLYGDATKHPPHPTFSCLSAGRLLHPCTFADIQQIFISSYADLKCLTRIQS
jgi:hypothetical protein